MLSPTKKRAATPAVEDELPPQDGIVIGRCDGDCQDEEGLHRESLLAALQAGSVQTLQAALAAATAGKVPQEVLQVAQRALLIGKRRQQLLAACEARCEVLLQTVIRAAETSAVAEALRRPQVGEELGPLPRAQALLQELRQEEARSELQEVEGTASSVEASSESPESACFEDVQFTDYELDMATEELIGEGGFSEVWSATLRDGTQVALKKATCKEGRGNLRAELLVLRKCLGDYVVPCYGTSPSALVLSRAISDLWEVGVVGGANFADRLHGLVGAARGVGQLMRCSVWYRDSKGANTLWYGRDHPSKLCDVSGVSLTKGYAPPCFVPWTESSEVYVFCMFIAEQLLGRHPSGRDHRPLHTSASSMARHLDQRADWPMGTAIALGNIISRGICLSNGLTMAEVAEQLTMLSAP